MKKLITLLMLVTLTSVSAQQSKDKVDYKSNYNSDELLEIGKTILDPVEKHEFYKHLFTVFEMDNLKYEDENSNKNLSEFRKLPNPLLYDFVKKHLSKYTVVNEKPISIKDLEKKDEDEEFTLRENIIKVDKLLIEKDSTFYEEFSRLIQPSYGQCGSVVEDINRNIITVFNGCGMALSIKYEYVLLKDNIFIDLGSGYDMLSKSEFKKLERKIKSKVKDYEEIAHRSGTQISQRPNGNFFITFFGYVVDEARATGGSIEITYETKDLKTFIPNSVTVEKLEWQSVDE